MLNAMPRDVRHLLYFACLIALVAQAIALTGVVRGPLEILWRRLTGDDFFSTQGWQNASFLFLYLGALPQRRELGVVVAVGVVATLIHLVFSPPSIAFAESPWSWLMIAVFWLSLSAVLALIVRWRRTTQQVEQVRIASLLGVGVAILLFSSYVSSFLNLTMVLSPRAYDLIVFHLDGSLGFQASILLSSWIRRSGLQVATEVVYQALPWASALFFGLYFQFVQPSRARPFSFPYVWILTMLAFPAYLLCPVSGPQPVFRASFPDELQTMLSLPPQVAITFPSFRNGVPSMHLGWALVLWLNARTLGNRWISLAFGGFALLTALATIGVGEHYLVDLIVAVPFVVMTQAMAMVGLPWRDPRRLLGIGVGLGLWLAWVLLIRLGGGPFLTVPGLTWLAIGATLVASVWAVRCMEAAGAELISGVDLNWNSMPKDGETDSQGKVAIGIYGLFFVSGFAGLVYEVLFSKALALTFGSTSTAAYTVLAVYMGGMAVGAWLGGRLAERSRRPLAAYAFCEMGIGLYCALTPAMFSAIRVAYVWIAGDIPPDAPVLTLVRVSLGTTALLVPTLLMGATLPLLVAHLEREHGAFGRVVARLYGSNTLGASLGALLCGYAILPALGVFRTTLLAALLNLLIALMAYQMFKRFGDSDAPQSIDGKARILVNTIRKVPGRSVAGVALLILGIGGAVTLALEVHYIHLLAVVAGNSTYAFSLMLSAFLFGLGVGSELGRKLLGSGLSHAVVLMGLEAGLAVAIWAGLFQWDSVPGQFAAYEYYDVLTTFGHREFVRAWICLLVMIPPALFIGAIYPVAMDAAIQGGDRLWLERLGKGVALNTLGNIVGVLGGGFVLLAALGAFGGLRILGLICLALALAALWVAAPRAKKVGALALATIAAAMALMVPSFEYSKLTTGANVYFRAQNWGDVVDRAESLDGGLTTVNRVRLSSGEPLLTLLTNGKFQGNDAASGEAVAQAGLALAPLLHTVAREDALVIGYGTGMSARTISDAGFRSVDIVDLSRDIIRLADQYFPSINDRVRERQGVSTFVTDGRNFLLLQKRKYDLIGMEISSIWFSGAASLYNREFYQLVKPRLNPGGILQQWVQLHHMHPTDLLRIVGSVRSEFRNVWIYYIGGQGIIVASDSEAAFPNELAVDLLDNTPSLRWALVPLGGTSRTLLADTILTPSGVDRLLSGFSVPADYWVSSDDNLVLEYSTPRGNSLDGTLETNVAMMRRFSRQ